MIHIGDDAKGEHVEIPVNHTGVFGQSGVGKTKLLKYMMAQARAEGFSVLIFDSKVTGAEFEGTGVELPFYLEESTDPDVFRSLLEGMRTGGHGNMERYRGAFIEVCDGTRTFEEIGRKLKLKLASAKGYYRAMYQEIFYDYGRLMKLLGGENFASIKAIDFKQPVSRVPTHRLPNLALQGLVVRSMVEALLRTEEKLIIIVDEAPNFVNQKRYNPAKDALQILDAQGRKPRIFGWYSGQTITGFDKANMKNLQFWIMGREMEKNEAKDVFDTQTSKALTVDEIKRMKVREFIVSTPDFAKVVMVPKLDDTQAPKRKDPILSRASPPETTSRRVDLEHKQLIINVSHSEKTVRMTTEGKDGQVVYVLTESGQPMTAPDIASKMAEHGWRQNPGNFMRDIGEELVRRGLIVFEGRVYRLPKFVKFDVKKEILA